MQKSGKLATQLAMAMALATLFGTSAFAEERHPNTTDQHTSQNQRWRSNGQQQQSGNWNRNENQNQNWNRGRGNYQQHDRGQTQQQFDRAQAYRQYNGGTTNQNWNRNQTWDRSRTYTQPQYQQQYDRGRTNQTQTWDRSRTYSSPQYQQQYDRGRTNQNWNRGQTYSPRYQADRGQFNRSWNGHRYNSEGWGDRYDNRGRRSFLGEGRVNRFEHERGGWRVWIDGGLYPFWVSDAEWRLFPLRVGLSIRLGGWYDPLGYVDVYDVGPYAYDGYGYYGGAYANGHLRGVVETVDYYRGTIVIRDDTTGAFVTAVMRGPEMGGLRPGDYVDFGGTWTGRGVFEAFQMYDVNNGY